MTTADDRARLAGYRAMNDEGCLFSPAASADLLRMAEEGLTWRERARTAEERIEAVRALAERDGRDRLAAWLASNGVDMPDTVALEAVAFILVALDGETP